MPKPIRTIKPKMSPKKTRLAFQKGAREILESLGAVNVSGPCDEWLLKTKYGDLTLHIDINYEGRDSGPGTVFTRFEDPKRAHEGGVDCNSYTGKWNHHFFKGSDLEYALYSLRFLLKDVVPEKKINDATRKTKLLDSNQHSRR